MILATMARPKPTPSFLVVKNGLKIELWFAGVDARAAVDDGDLELLVVGAGFDGDDAAGRRGLGGVRQEVDEDLLDQFRIEVDGRDVGRVVLTKVIG